MNSKTRQKRSLCHFGRLCRRAVALTLVLAMLLPTAAFGFDAMQKPTIVADSGEFPTITVETNAVVDRWFDPTGPESAADYLTGYLEVAIWVKSGVKGGAVQAFNTVSLALHYSPLLTPYDWTVQKGWSEAEPAKDSNGKEIVNPVDLTGKGVSFDNLDMATMQTLKNNQLTTAVGHVSGKNADGGFLYIMANADRPVTLEDDTVLAVVRFKYDLQDDAHPAGILPVAKDGVQKWVDPTSDDCLIRLGTPAELGKNYIQPEVYYDSADNGMFYSADPNRYREATDGSGTTSTISNLIPLNTAYDGTIVDNQVNFTLVNKTTYNDGGLSLDDLASVLFYDWDDTLIGVLIVPRDGDARKLVNDYVRENLIHPDLRTAAVDSLARKDNYRGKYPSTPMAATGTDATMDSGRTDKLVGSDYPLTNKLDYVFMQRPMEKVTTDVNGDPVTTNTWRQKGTGETDLTTEEWDENYPFVHGWARLTDKNWNNPSSMWTTIGVGELATYTGLSAGAYPEDLTTGVITANLDGAELTVTDKDFQFESFDFRDHPLAPGGVCSVKAVYEPGATLLNKNYSYQMISEPYYNKMNDPAAASGGAYSVDVVYERANTGIKGNLNGIVRARQLELRQETTTDLRWENEYLVNANISELSGKTKTTYSTVPVDNVDVVNIQLVLSGRQNKVDYFLVEANNASFVTGGARSDTNINRAKTAHLVDNYNYNTADNDVDRIYYRAEYVDTDSDGKVNDDRSGSYGFVLLGTINNLAQKALEHKDGLLDETGFGSYLSINNFNDMNLRVRGTLEDGKLVGGSEVSFGNWATVQAAWEAAAVAARTAHGSGNNTWWNVEQDLPQFTYHQIQLYINDYVNNSGTATLLSADAADKQIITWCNLHEECASARTGKPNSLAKLVKAALAGEKDKIMLLTLDEVESMSHIRSNERGTAFATISQLADALISAAQGVNGIRTLDPNVLTPNSDGTKSPAYWAAWDSIQGYILANPKPTNTTGLDAAIKNSRDTAWWNEGENAPAAGSLADLVAAEEKAVETGRDAWINYYRYRDAFTDMKTNGVSPQAQWTRITENLVKNIDGEPFDTYDAFKAAFRSAVAAVGPYDPDDKDYWNKLQYIMAGDTRTPEVDQYAKYWWHNGYSRITDLVSLLTAAQQANAGNTAVWDMFTLTDLYDPKLPQLHFRHGFNGTEDVYTDTGTFDIDAFKTAVLTFVKTPGAQIATGDSNTTQRNNSWNQLQYYLIHKDDPGGIDLTQRDTNLAIQAEAPYYWWKDGKDGEVYPLTPGVGDANILELDEAIYRAAFNGNPKALDELTVAAAASFRLVPSYAGTEKNWDGTDGMTKYDATTIGQLKSNLETLAKAAGETDCKTLSWRQIQHYLLGGGYLTAADPNLPTDTATDKDNATTGVKNYWWKLGNANPNLATEPIDTDLDTFLGIIDEVVAGTYTGTFYEAIELYIGYTEGSGSRLNLHGGWTFFPQPIEFEFGSVMNLETKLDNIVMQLTTDGGSAADVLDWFVLQYYAFEDNDYWGGPLVSKEDAKSFYLQVLTDSGMTNWAPSYVEVTTASIMMVPNRAPMTPAKRIENLTEQITQLTEAIRETPEFAAEYAQEIARLMAALVELKALLEPTQPTCTCGSEDGTHAEDCPLYVAPEAPTCTCGSEDGTHAEDCPLYVAPEEPTCTCGSEDGTHAEDCPLYVVPEEPTCTCGSEDGTHAEDCPLYVAPEEPTCTCGSEDETHAEDCPFYVAPEEPTCTCGSEDGTHTEDCPLYVAPDDGGADVSPDLECTCGAEDGTHSSDCPLYTALEEELTDPEVPGAETPAPEPDPEPDPAPDPEPDPTPEAEMTETEPSVPEPSEETLVRKAKRRFQQLIALENLFFDSGGWKMNGITTQKNISPPGQWMTRTPWLWTMVEGRRLA